VLLQRFWCSPLLCADGVTGGIAAETRLAEKSVPMVAMVVMVVMVVMVAMVAMVVMVV
jgi:hypothetical protein